MPIYKKVNKDFFKKWSSSMAYVLGFFAADGYITLNKRGANFWCIQITDKKLLENIRRAIGSNHKISIRIMKKEESLIYRLQIGSKEMCDDLRALGFKERKTKNLVVPSVPNKYFSSFTRGYFDGDGNVWVGLLNKTRKNPTMGISVMFTSCSDVFLRAFWLRLKDFGLLGGSIYKSPKGYFRLGFSTRDSLKLSNFMYNSNIKDFDGLFLDRKRKIFKKFIRLQS